MGKHSWCSSVAGRMAPPLQQVMSVMFLPEGKIRNQCSLYYLICDTKLCPPMIYLANRDTKTPTSCTLFT